MDLCASQPEDMTALVLSQALAQSRCSAELCSLSQVFHRGGWVVFSHAGASPHVCQVCKPGTLSLHIVSVEVLQGTERRELVADVARWLDHLHTVPAPLPDSDAVAGADGIALRLAAAAARTSSATW